MKNRFATLLIAVLGVLASSATSQAGVLSSAAFSFGYGFTSSWNTSETAGSNTPFTQGDFTLTPTVFSGLFSSNGPTFPGRVLTNGGGNGTGITTVAGPTLPFAATLTGSYTGGLPAGADINNPNLQIRINITELRVRALAHPAFQSGNETLAFAETTISHTAMSSFQALQTSADTTTAANFNPVTWNPTDYETPGTSFTRSFAFVNDDIRAIDGFEIFATIDLLFNSPVPEPSTALLVTAGLTMLTITGRRRNASRR